jgi:hypothetical protein
MRGQPPVSGHGVLSTHISNWRTVKRKRNYGAPCGADALHFWNIVTDKYISIYERSPALAAKNYTSGKRSSWSPEKADYLQRVQDTAADALGEDVTAYYKWAQIVRKLAGLPHEAVPAREERRIAEKCGRLFYRRGLHRFHEFLVTDRHPQRKAKPEQPAQVEPEAAPCPA